MKTAKFTEDFNEIANEIGYVSSYLIIAISKDRKTRKKFVGNYDTLSNQMFSCLEEMGYKVIFEKEEQSEISEEGVEV